jgi:ubiquinone/menaquinone biosynthesis C-methylase UbiE
LTNAGPEDSVLDVACGAGLVVCAFAPIVRRATGVDLTPAMIDRARALQEEKALRNVSWQVGDVLPLPFASNSFSIVTCRYALHHMENPAAVVAEMSRVCSPGGRVLLVDMLASPDPKVAANLNEMERLRDPSHVRAMPLSELEELLQKASLSVERTARYGLDWDLETVLENSSPRREDLERIREMFANDLETDGNGMSVRVRRQDDRIWFTYPIVAIVAKQV